MAAPDSLTSRVGIVRDDSVIFGICRADAVAVLGGGLRVRDLRVTGQHCSELS